MFMKLNKSRQLAMVASLLISTGLVTSSPAFAGELEDFYQNHKCPSSENPGQGNAFGLGKLFTEMGGLDDNFAAGNIELTTPRAALAAIPQIITYQANHGRPTMSRDYDERHANEIFIETLDIADAHKVKSGWVLFKFKNYGGLSYNDTVYMGNMVDLYKEANAPTGTDGEVDRANYRAFGHRIGTVLSANDSDGNTLFINDAATGITAARLENVELFSAAHGGTVTLLEQIQSDGLVDFYIQDDTQIDFVAVVGCSTGNAQNNGNNGNAWGPGGNPGGNAGGNGNGNNGNGNGNSSTPPGLNPGEGE